MLYNGVESYPGSRCYHTPRTWPSSRSNDQPLCGAEPWPLQNTFQEHLGMKKKKTESGPLIEKQFPQRVSTFATYPERSFCRPGAPSSTGAFPHPERGSLPLFSSPLTIAHRPSTECWPDVTFNEMTRTAHAGLTGVLVGQSHSRPYPGSFALRDLLGSSSPSHKLRLPRLAH